MEPDEATAGIQADFLGAITMGLGLQTGYGAEGAQVGLARLLAQREAAKRLQMDEQQQQQNEVYRNKALAQQEELKRLALEEAAKRGADLDAYRQALLTQRGEIAGELERGRNERASETNQIRQQIADAANQLRAAGIDARMALGLAQIALGQQRVALQAATPKLSVQTTADEEGSPVRQTIGVFPGGRTQVVNQNTPVTNSQVDFQNQLKRSGVTLEQLEELSNRINQGSGPLARVTGWLRRGAAEIGMDPEMKQYQALRESAGPAVARQGGHTGVLTQKDVDSSLAVIPKGGTTQDEAQRLWGTTKAIRQGQKDSMKPMKSHGPVTVSPDGWKPTAVPGVRARKKSGG